MRNTSYLYLGLVIVAILGIASPSLAEETTTATIESISYESLGAAKPWILPGNPFYFLKEWKRKIEFAFAFDDVKKAEKEAKFASEKVAEVKALAEKDPQNNEAIARALENYKESVERARARFEALATNPNAAELLQKLAERRTAHEALFTGLQQKFMDKAELKEKVGDVQKTLSGSTMPQKTPAGQNATPKATPGVPSKPMSSDSQNKKTGGDCPEIDAVSKKYEQYGMRQLTDQTIVKAYYEELNTATGICVKRNLQGM